MKREYSPYPRDGDDNRSSKRRQRGGSSGRGGGGGARPSSAPPPPPMPPPEYGGGGGGGASGRIVTGTIARYDENKGFGFIAPDDRGEDIYFARGELPSDVFDCKKQELMDAEVEFELVEKSDGKLRARQITILNAPNLRKGGGSRASSDMGGGGGGRMLVGKIMRLDRAKGYGFISSPDENGDIFFMISACSPALQDGITRGEEYRNIEVELELGFKDGKPRANRVDFAAGGRGSRPPLDTGVFVNFDVKKGFGFIKPDHETEDIFVMRNALPVEIQHANSREEVVGRRVEFEYKTMPDGKMRAQNCILIRDRAPAIVGGGPPPMGGMGGPPMGQHFNPRLVRGRIRTFNKGKGYGFIEVPGGGDAFLLPSELPPDLRESNSLVGMEVEFEIVTNDEGKPRAKGVRVMTGLPPPPTYGNLPPPPMMGMNYGPPAPYMMGVPPQMAMGGMPPPPYGGMPPPTVPMTGASRVRPGEKLNGQIVRFYPQKGYGFLSPDEIDEDIFFLKTEMPEELRDVDVDDVVAKRVSFQVKIMKDGKLRAQRMTLLQGRGGGQGHHRGEDLPPLSDDLVEEMVDFLVDQGGGCNLGKFTAKFTKVKKSQLQKHFDVASFSSGQRIELPEGHPARPEGMERGGEGNMSDDEAPDEEGSVKEEPEEDEPIDDDELSIPPNPGCTPFGKIRSYDPAKGYGFIVVEGRSEDVYFPRSALPANFQAKKRREMPELNGVMVAFEEIPDESGAGKGPKASKVNLCLKWHESDQCYLLKRE
eukprot:CAMPEP_0206605046 /NCGR_PEP_ID=MMETSP0325_2-20121206/50104_1 /ASSEMBLY_ACC=CAM_ASM_000347 /TAXON_ID=2866 /ORGANISM="Crypthecodinium cohnii, Strain Seligo" /LENGTH=762 /DNA_ID=CAMNT_0054120359 /DNA_START=99 /DNA_END=2387 /DNA_ORIENTATION=+